MSKPGTYTLATLAVIFSLTACGANPVKEKTESQPATESAATESPATESAATESPAPESAAPESATTESPAPESKAVSPADEVASNPGKFVRAEIQADNMGYLYAAVYNPSNVAVANVYVIVVHIDAATRQPDNQSVPLLVAARLAPRQRGRLKLEGLQVFKQVDLNSYRVIVAGAELAK